MNVYDFDGTIYEGDSTEDFWKFAVKRHPKCLKTLPVSAILGLGYALKIVERDTLKSHLYPFVTEIPDIDKELEIFWETHEKNVMDWYLKQKRDDDLIISASPDFVVEPMCKKLGIKVIASPVDRFTGTLLGPNNHGQRKVERYRAAYGDTPIEEFYSDSHTDDPLAKIAIRAFITKHGRISDWK